MRSLVLHLQSGTQYERIEEVVSFVGVDDSGSFGIMPGHVRMVACLSSGLARFREENGTWQYVAHPGAVLYMKANDLVLSTRRYLRDSDYTRVSTELHTELLAEEKNLLEMREILRHLEDEMLKRMWAMQREIRSMP